jgi:hypothetical protein
VRNCCEIKKPVNEAADKGVGDGAPWRRGGGFPCRRGVAAAPAARRRWPSQAQVRWAPPFFAAPKARKKFFRLSTAIAHSKAARYLGGFEVSALVVIRGPSTYL